MEQALDNPAWSALTSGNANLALGTDEVKYFDKTVSPFVGLVANTAENLPKLYEQIPYTGPVGFINPIAIELPTEWEILNSIQCLQMIFQGKASTDNITANIVPLTEKDIPQMLELTKLTKPGPFAERTIDFGHYAGIFEGNKLVAMAGQRLHIYSYAEISAVCTHPEYLGRGYAKQLLSYQAARIQAAGEIPMLHVRIDNDRAIAVYESLGFVKRMEMWFYMMKKR